MCSPRFINQPSITTSLRDLFTKSLFTADGVNVVPIVLLLLITPLSGEEMAFEEREFIIEERLGEE